MLTDEMLLERTGLLLSQREVLLGSRYAGLQQLREHDNRLLAGLRLLRRRGLGRTDTGEIADSMGDSSRPWLAWLLTPLDASPRDAWDAKALHAPEATLSQALWLAAIKLTLDELPLRQLLASSAIGGGGEFCWQLASYLAVPGLSTPGLTSPDLTSPGLDIGEGEQVAPAYFWYLASTGQVAAKDRLLAHAGDAGPVALQAKLALYLLGQGGDEPRLLEQLLQQGLQDSDYVPLLLCGAPAQSKVAMLNLLLQTGALPRRVGALGYSGLSKFVPLLRDLATQTESPEQTEPSGLGEHSDPGEDSEPDELAEAAADALCLLLGVEEGERLLETAVEAVPNFGPEPVLAGRTLEGDALDAIWHGGNQAQRWAAACHAKLRRPELPLSRPDGLLGGQWHSC
ncbi:hypothetical protein LZP73_13505 [Shewanella sp. AS16]|uniref:hypothetical protein n=1 Tax=Shewanella sp. AS16 TaxID=2907625 RepID=UPI001F349C93|nr:hypothetical protein [Shewanella sp. AS16]MCE9687209.1 hypothetical protein [Shewanella sp. AS16]